LSGKGKGPKLKAEGRPPSASLKKCGERRKNAQLNCALASRKKRALASGGDLTAAGKEISSVRHQEEGKGGSVPE